MITLSIKALHIVHICLCLILAWLQLNDPDPWIWTSFYLLCSLPALLALLNKVNKKANVGVMVFCGVMLALTASGFVKYLVYFPNESLVHGMRDDRPYIEEAREFIGALFITFLTTIYLYLSFRKKKL